MKWRVACIQTDIFFGDPNENMKHIESKIKEAVSNEKPDIIVLPELWTTGYDLTRIEEIGDQNGKNMKEFVSNWSKTYNVNIVNGSIAKVTGDGVYNTMYISDRNGNIIHEYSKLHLFKLMDEHLHLKAGHTDSLFELEGEVCSGFICYDIRFPEWIRKHTLSGAKVVFVVAEWPLARLNHWRTLLLARAIENQCYVVACNRVGDDPKNTFAGHSMIINPWGEILAEAGESEEIITGEIDLQKVSEVRKHIPIFNDRRPDFY